MNEENEILFNKIYEQTKDFGRTHFVKEIMNLQRKNNQLQEEVSLLDMRTDENIKLQNNWNELKKYISAEWYCFDNESVEFEVARKIMKKAQELEQGKDE